MYIPPAFSEQRLDVIHDLMRRDSFASVVGNGPDGLIASHVPVLLRPDRGAFGALQLHLARQNPQGILLAQNPEVLVIFQGPHAYISPTWYKSSVAVPTWNYLAIHAYGRPRTLDDAELTEHLTQLASSYEPVDGWSPSRMPPEVLEKMKRNIVGFEIEISRLEGKWKLNQNRPREDVLAAIEGLLATGDEESSKVAELMKEAMRARE
jgi:transcriptional regulator